MPDRIVFPAGNGRTSAAPAGSTPTWYYYPRGYTPQQGGRGRLNPSWYYNPQNGQYSRTAPALGQIPANVGTYAGAYTGNQSGQPAYAYTGGGNYAGQGNNLSAREWGNMLNGRGYNAYTNKFENAYGLSDLNIYGPNDRGLPNYQGGKLDQGYGSMNQYGQPLGTLAPYRYSGKSGNKNAHAVKNASQDLINFFISQGPGYVQRGSIYQEGWKKKGGPAGGVRVPQPPGGSNNNQQKTTPAIGGGVVGANANWRP